MFGFQAASREAVAAMSMRDKSSRALPPSLVLHSSASGEPVEMSLHVWSLCSEVDRRRLIGPDGRCIRQPSLLWMEWQLWIWRKLGEWSGLKVPTVVAIVDGESTSMVDRARGQP